MAEGIATKSAGLGQASAMASLNGPDGIAQLGKRSDPQLPSEVNLEEKGSFRWTNYNHDHQEAYTPRTVVVTCNGFARQYAQLELLTVSTALSP